MVMTLEGGPDRVRAQARSLVLICLGTATALLAAYSLEVFQGLENPLTHAFPVSFDYLAYVQYYYQTAADVHLFAEASGVCFTLAALALVHPFVTARPAFRRVAGWLRSVGARSSRFRTAILAVPLLLIEAGFLLYGGLMALGRFDFQLSVVMRQELVVKVLVFGPSALAVVGSASEQDYYFLVLFLTLLAASYYRFGSVRRVLQVGALAMMPLPTLIYFFDNIEFNMFFAATLDRAGLTWFSNALLLYLSISILVAATAFPFASKLASRLAWR